jgi:hypothetical protein
VPDPILGLALETANQIALGCRGNLDLRSHKRNQDFVPICSNLPFHARSKGIHTSIHLNGPRRGPLGIDPVASDSCSLDFRIEQPVTHQLRYGSDGDMTPIDLEELP